MHEKDKLDPANPVIFTGPSLSEQEIRQRLRFATVLPPVARGDLYRTREQGGSIFLIIDGVFSHQFAISPREVIDVILDGALVLGAASMGALRAAECWPAGMQGVGLVYRLYRAGVLESDDEVAVTTNPAQAFSATSVALINVRYAVSKAMKARVIDRATGRDIVASAMKLGFRDRHWETILGGAGINSEIKGFLKGLDIKKKDALDAVEEVARWIQDSAFASTYVGRKDHPFAGASRYLGHDRYLGSDQETLSKELTIWLFGSGRYQKYIWALVVDELEFRDRPESLDQRPAALRDRLVRVLCRVLQDVDSFAQRVWYEIEFLDELEAELLRWYAVKEAAAAGRTSGVEPSLQCVARLREELAIAHGFRDWSMLEEDVSDGMLFGAIPFDWLEKALNNLALASSHCQVWAMPPRPQTFE